MNQILGVLYLTVGLVLTVIMLYRLVTYWHSFAKTGRYLFAGVVLIMTGFTLRGIELTWFHAPGLRPAAYPAMVGALFILYAMLKPVDPRLQKPWQEALKEQEPDNYMKYLNVLEESARNRMITTKHADKYLTNYGEEAE